MKHRIADDVNINVSVDIPTQDLEDLIDRATERVISIIVVATAANILKSIFKK